MVNVSVCFALDQIWFDQYRVNEWTLKESKTNKTSGANALRFRWFKGFIWKVSSHGGGVQKTKVKKVEEMKER